MGRYKTGKLPARPNAVKLKFGTFADRPALPKPPARFGHERIGRAWGMLANDEHSCCVLSGAAHEHMVWTHEGGETAAFDDAGVLSDYAAVAGFDPARPDTDQGTDMAAAAEYRRTDGIRDAAGARHKIEAYTALDPGAPEDLAVATWMMGTAGVGLRLPDRAMDDFDRGRVWEDTSQPPGDGHYVPIIGRNSAGNFLIVTWGRFHAMSPEFYSRYCDEAICYVSREMLRDKATPEGFDIQALMECVATIRRRR